MGQRPGTWLSVFTYLWLSFGYIPLGCLFHMKIYRVLDMGEMVSWLKALSAPAEDHVWFLAPMTVHKIQVPWDLLSCFHNYQHVQGAYQLT